jgi:two-component system, NtrC family, sensor kinase
MFSHLISNTISYKPADGKVAVSAAMEGGYLRCWSIILATLGFAVTPLFILGAVIYHQFSVSYTAKIMDNMKTGAKSRCNAIDLFLNERIARLFSLAHTQTLEQLQNEDYLNKEFNIIQSRY